MKRKEAIYSGLDLIPVLFEDTSLTSPDFFQITEFPVRLTAGKNLFKFQGNPTNLKVGSLLGIEILDYNGDPIYHEVVDYLDQDKSRVIAIYVYDTTSPGDCTVTITGEAVNIEGQQVTADWQNKTNVRWTRSCPVNPVTANESEIIFESLPTVLVSEQIGVQLDRVYPNNTQFPTYNTGSITYFSYNEQPAISITGGQFNADMTGGTITVSNPINPRPTAIYPISTTAYVSKISKVLSPSLALLETEYTAFSSQSVYIHTYDSFDASTFSIEYEATPTYVPTENSQSFALIQIENLQPATGDIARIKVFTNNKGTVGTWELVNDFELEDTEIFISSTSSLFPDQSIGIFTSQSIINTYWQPHTYQNGVEIIPTTLQWTTSSLSNAMFISSSINITAPNSVQVAQISSSYQGIFLKDSSYKISLDALGTTISTTAAKLSIYLSGSSFYQDPTDYFNQSFPVKFGKRIGELTSYGNQRFDDQIFSFEADFDGTGVVLLVVESGEWQVSDIHVTTDNDAGYSPNYTRIKTPIQTTHKIDNQISFKTEYYNVAGVKSKQISYVYDKNWQGGNRYIDGDYSMLTGSLYVADSLNSGVAISGYPNAGWLRSLGYEGFAAGFPGFLMWSGSALPESAGTKGGVPYSGVGLELYANTSSYFRYSTTDSEIDIQTDSFFFGQYPAPFISGSNGNIEISASNFHLSREGNVTASNALFTGVALANIIRDKTITITTANSSSYLQAYTVYTPPTRTGYRVILDGSAGGEIVRRVRINCELLYPIADFQLPSLSSTAKLDVTVETNRTDTRIYDVFTPGKTAGVSDPGAATAQPLMDSNGVVTFVAGGATGATWLILAGTEHPLDHEFKGQLKVSSSGEYYRHGNRLYNYGQFYDMTTQSASIADTPYAMTFNSSSAFNNNIDISNNTRMRTTYPGIYNLQFSAQLANNANQNINYVIWIRQNGTDVPDTAGDVEVVKSAGTTGRSIAAWNYLYETTAANEYVELMWAASTVNGQLLYAQSSSIVPRPAIPSIIATITQIA